MASQSDQPLKILIAEDSAPDRLILESIIAQAGHKPVSVADGLQALRQFAQDKPDIVLLDVLMPNMGGIQAAKEMRQLAEDEFIPIIFLTSLSDAESLVECIEAGGDDFVPKPYNRVVLQSKIKAFSRMQELHATLALQKDQIETHNKHLIREQTVAKQVFDKIAHTGCLNLNNIRYYMSPLAVFNGDVLVAEVSPSGSMMVLLGDFTGHGLPAAIGSMPLASTFYGMVRKGFSMAEILREINSKLHDILPVGFFCCATCIDINFMKRRLRVWNGGLPECFLFREETQKYELLPSKHLPLGVLSNRAFSAESERIQLDLNDRFYMWSDGIFEVRNDEGEMFGEGRLHKIMETGMGQGGLFDDILQQVNAHVGEGERDDDISLVEITVQDVELVSKSAQAQAKNQSRLEDWHMNFVLDSSSLQHFDPLPLLVNILNEVPGLRPSSTLLYTVLAELYANALEHGVLGLSSELKSSPAGFAEYYNQRKEQLGDLKDGRIEFELQHLRSEEGGELTITIKDSGKGFGIEKIEKIAQTEKTTMANPDRPDYHGRGIQLMTTICDWVIIHPPGNHVQIIFKWVQED